MQIGEFAPAPEPPAVESSKSGAQAPGLGPGSVVEVQTADREPTDHRAEPLTGPRDCARPQRCGGEEWVKLTR